MTFEIYEEQKRFLLDFPVSYGSSPKMTIEGKTAKDALEQRFKTKFRQLQNGITWNPQTEVVVYPLGLKKGTGKGQWFTRIDRTSGEGWPVTHISRYR